MTQETITHEKPPIPTVERELSPSGAITVDGQFSDLDNGFMSGQGVKCLAEVTLGGLDGADGKHYDPQRLKIFRVTNETKEFYENLAARAKESGVEPTDCIIYSEGDIKNEVAPAAGFIPDNKLDEGRKTNDVVISATNRVILGRRGNIRWFEYGIDRERSPDWTPFAENLSISREQVKIMRAGDWLGFSNGSENSTTLIKGAMSEEYNPATHASSPHPPKARRVAGFLGWLKRKA